MGNDPLKYHEYAQAARALQRLEETLGSPDLTVPTHACIRSEGALMDAAKAPRWTHAT